MKPDAFLKTLKKVVPPVIVCTGDEVFMKKEVFEGVKAALGRSGSAPSVDLFEARDKEKTGAQRLLRELATGGLFSTNQVFLVRKGGALLKEAASLLVDHLDGSLPNRVVFFADGLDGRTRFAKKLKEINGVVECKKLYATSAPWLAAGSGDSELTRWAGARAKTKGLDLNRDGVAFLCALTGNDLFLLDSELEKLSLALPKGKPAGVAEVEQATGMSAVHTPFELWEQIESGDCPGALDTLSVILRNGLRSTGGRLETDATAIASILLGLFRERIRLSSQVALLLWEKADDRRIMDALSIRSAFYLKKLKASAKRLRASTLTRVSKTLLVGERRLKRKGHKAIPVVEEIVIKLAGAKI